MENVSFCSTPGGAQIPANPPVALWKVAGKLHAHIPGFVVSWKTGLNGQTKGYGWLRMMGFFT
jgi:hypothetical protein